jgi:ComF family protein
MVKILDGLTRVAQDLLFPPQCALCGAGGSLLCDACAGALIVADGPRCDICWMPVRRGEHCSHCLEDPPAFASLRAAFVMEDGARRLAHELKYEGMTSLAEPMAYRMALRGEPIDADVIVPVPLHAGRERARGYNQAAELAKQLAANAGVAFDARAVRRVRNTEPLAKTMHRAERQAIVEGAFAARRERVEGRRVLLVDDVVTTGATLNACAWALLDAGAAGVRCVTWARAD